MESINQTLNSNTVYSKLNNLNNSIQYSNSDIARVFSNLADVIPDDGYKGFYVNQLKRLGIDKFVELANKARATSDTPARLFCWYLKNDSIVR